MNRPSQQHGCECMQLYPLSRLSSLNATAHLIAALVRWTADACFLPFVRDELENYDSRHARAVRLPTRAEATTVLSLYGRLRKFLTVGHYLLSIGMLIRQVPGNLPSLIPLVCPTVTLGRDAREVDFCLNTTDDKNVISRCHAKLVRIPQSHPAPPLYQIISLGANGLSVNGQRRTDCLLHDGDEIVFAPSHKPHELHYRFYATQQTAFAAASARTLAAAKQNGWHSPSTSSDLSHASSDRGGATAAAAVGVSNTTVANHYSAMPADLYNRNTAANHYSAMPAGSNSAAQPHISSMQAATDGVMSYDRLDEPQLDYSRYMLHSTLAQAPAANNFHSTMPSSNTRAPAPAYSPLAYSAMPLSSSPPPAPPVLRHQTTTPLSPPAFLSPSSTSPSSSPTPALASSLPTWNTRFQSALDLPESNPTATLHKYSALSTLSSDFVSLAKLYGRTIIEEYFLQPPQQRTIQESSGMGGLAGGRKYVVRGILFKLCSDVELRGAGGGGRWLYGGDGCDYENANKVGSHELKSATRFFAFHSIGLRVPMLALVEYLGYRLLAMPILPLPTAVPPLLGSSDAGRTVYASDEQLNSLMASAAAELHLAQHTVNGVEMYTAGDVEGHRGDDGRYYILDLARSFPPENPTASKQPQAAMYRLLRPELLQLLKADGGQPLSSDAYTRWGMEAADVHNARVDEATRALHERYLPALARKWVVSEKSNVDRLLADDESGEGSGAMRSMLSQPATFAPDEELSVEGVDIRFLRLSEELHCHGLNMRHIGLLRHHILTEYGSSEHAADVGLLLLVEAVSRTLKSLLRHRLRACVEKVTSVSTSAEYDCVKCVVDFFNLCTASHNQSTAFWSGELEAALRLRFGDQCLHSHESSHLFALVTPHLLRVLSYLCMACGVALSPACEDSLSSGAMQYVFTVVDVELRVQSRSMAIIDYAEARVMQAQAAVFAQEAEAADDRAKQALSNKRTANGRHKAQPPVDANQSDTASTTADPAHLRSTAIRLLALAVQIFDRLRHSDPFNNSYKQQARQCKQQLQHMQQEQHAAHEDNSSQHASLQLADLVPLSQSSHSSLHPLAPASTAGAYQLPHHHQPHPQTIRTGLSTAFQRFTLQPAITSHSITRSSSSLHGLMIGSGGSQQQLLSSQPSNASLMSNLTPPAAWTSNVPSTPTSTASFVAPPPVSSIQQQSSLLARSVAMAGSLSTLLERTNGHSNEAEAAAMETEAEAGERESESTAAPVPAASPARDGRRRALRDRKRPTAAARSRSNEDAPSADAEHDTTAVDDDSRQSSLAVNRPRRTATRNSSKAEDKNFAEKEKAAVEEALTVPRKRRR